jgi:long-chain acyl-CoA synthetase
MEDSGTATRTQDPHPSYGSEASIARDELPLENIYRNEREHASRIFLTQPVRGTVREWNWGAAIGEVRRVAAHLKAQNWPPGSRVAIVAKNSAWWMMADFAIWMAGHASVPIFPTLRETARDTILEHSQPVACFLGALDRLPEIEGTALEHLHRISFPTAFPAAGTTSWEDIVAAQEPLAECPVRDPLDIATIIYTSGTTGEPKGVMQSFQALALMAKSMHPVLSGGGSLDRMLSYLPLAHIAERAIVELNSLYQPLHIFFAESQETFLTDLGRAHPTVFFTVPRLLVRFQHGVLEKIAQQKLELLLRLPIVNGVVRRRILKALALESVRLAASGSAPLPVDVLEWYRRLGLNLVEGYGMTETGITHVPLPGKLRPGYVGNASAYAETRISDEGEIQIKGPMNMTGYFRNASLTQSSFTDDGYFHTGDRGEIDTEGRLRIIGRIKEEFKTSKGKYIIPAPIEHELAASGLLESVCVLGQGMPGPFAAVVLVPESRTACAAPETRVVFEQRLERERLRVNQTLEHHEQLRFLVVVPEPWTVDNGFMTPTLKVRRARIEERLAPLFSKWESAGTTVIWLES